MTTPPRTPTTAALHEEHTCRDCGAVITLPYARPPKHIGWAVPDPAPPDEARLLTDDRAWWRKYDHALAIHEWYGVEAAIAREYAKEPQP